MTKTYFSKRIYKNTLPKDIIDVIQKSLLTFNQAKRYAYSLILREKRTSEKYEKSVHMMVKNKYGINDYIANSAVQEAGALIKSQEELKKQYIRDTEEQIKKRLKKIKELEKQLRNKNKMLDSLVKGKFKAYQGANENKSDSFYYIRYKYRTDIYYDAYEFEHEYLRPVIKNLENRISMIKQGLNKQNQKLQSLENKIRGVVFGGRKLLKAQYTKDEYINNHELWKEDFQYARTNRMLISGRKDAKYGNFVFKYDAATNFLNITLEDKILVIENLHFPHGQDIIENAFSNHFSKKSCQPVAWEIEDHKDYYIFKIMVKPAKNKYANSYRRNGVIGFDINYDHLAVVEVNKHGNLVDKLIIPYDLDGKTSGQAVKILEQVAVDLVNIAKIKKKPLIREDLDLQNSKAKLKYGSKVANKKITQLAYSRLITAVESRAEKEGVAVFKVNPAFTSQIGKVKYMKAKGLSIHESAAYVIARRGMGYKDKVPPMLLGMLPEKIVVKHHWAHWNYVCRFLKEVKPHYFYGIGKIDTNSLTSLKEFANQISVDKYRLSG